MKNVIFCQIEIKATYPRTHIMAFEGDSKVNWFIGNYSEYEADLKQRLGTDTLIPKRIKYRKLQ